jgi:cell division protein FtsB
LLASESEVRELLDSIELESEKLKEEVENLSSGDMPAGNGEFGISHIAMTLIY